MGQDDIETALEGLDYVQNDETGEYDSLKAVPPTAWVERGEEEKDGDVKEIVPIEVVDGD